jgi:hypothetical protein
LKWIDVDSKREMHTAMGDCVVLKKLGKGTERKRENGRGWGYFILGLYENYDEGKNHHENERTQDDVSSYDFFEMCNDVSNFYYMVTEFYKDNPVSWFRVARRGSVTVLGLYGMLRMILAMMKTNVLDVPVTSFLPTLL